jgi:tRNA threonylcarbamoyladenosine biosynthesis protein TsaB
VKILALDTATENCSAALLIDRTVIARERLLERGHAAQILPMIDEVLAAAGIALQSVDAIAFGRGPGGFTGVRLAASVTQGLAFGVGVPVVPVSNLRALAQRLLAADASIEHVVVCTDARMGEVYWGCFERRDGLAALVGEEQLSAPEGVRLPQGWVGNDHGHASCFGAGRGFAAYPQLAAAMRPLLQGIREDLLPRATEIAVLASPEAAAGRIFPAEQALPIYLRNDVLRAGGAGH